MARPALKDAGHDGKERFLMLCKRIIPCLDTAGGRVVKGVRFEGLKDCGDPAELALRYYMEGADELAFLDISASSEKRKTASELARKVSREVFIPFLVGGGISGLDDISAVLGAGADKVSINTAAVADPRLIEKAASRYGSQCVVVAIDAKRKARGKKEASGDPLPGWEVMTFGGKVGTGLDAIMWAKAVAGLGAGEILLTSMDSDGVQRGYDMALTRAVSDAVDIPVIASGGAGVLKDFKDVLTEGGADAALAASLFHSGQLSIGQVKSYLFEEGLAVRTGVASDGKGRERTA